MRLRAARSPHDRALAQSHGTLWLSDTRVARKVVETIRNGESEKRFYPACRERGAVSIVRFRNAPGHASEVPVVARVPGDFERPGDRRVGPQPAPAGVLA